MPPLILLAGGASTRMGQPKGLVSMGGQAWLEVQLLRLQAAGFHRVVLVLGFNSEEYFRESPWVKVQSQHPDLGVDLVVNPVPEQGAFSSLQVGIQNMKDSVVEGLFVLPVDVPVPEPGVFQDIIISQETGALQRAEAVIPMFQGQSGHPVWLSSVLAKKILEMDARLPSARLDFIIRDVPKDRVFRVEVQDPFVVMNLNTPADFLKLSEDPRKLLFTS